MTTIPLLISFLTILSVAFTAFKQRQASYPAKDYDLGTLLTWIDFINTVLNALRASGPKRQGLFSMATPLLTTPETTRPTPSTVKVSFISN